MNSTSLFLQCTANHSWRVCFNHSTRGMLDTCTVWCANYVCMFYIEYKHTNIFIYTYTYWIEIIKCEIWYHCLALEVTLTSQCVSGSQTACQSLPRGWKLHVSDRSLTDTYSSLHLLLSQFEIKKKKMSVIDAARCYGLCDKPWTWRGRGAQAWTHWDPVLQSIPICSHINSPTVCHTLIMDANNTVW